jgi:hypothetical protein
MTTTKQPNTSPGKTETPSPPALLPAPPPRNHQKKGKKGKKEKKEREKREKERKEREKKYKSAHAALSSLAKKDEEIDASLHIGDGLLSQVIEWQSEEWPSEINGFGVVADGTIEYLILTGRGDIGGVRSDENSVYDAIMCAIEEGYETVNFQWHSHPGMTPYWSGTDITAQVRTLRDALKINPSGHFYYAVWDGIMWITKKFEWEDGVVKYNDGAVTMGKNNTEMPTERWDYSYKSYAGHAGYSAQSGLYGGYGRGYAYTVYEKDGTRTEYEVCDLCGKSTKKAGLLIEGTAKTCLPCLEWMEDWKKFRDKEEEGGYLRCPACLTSMYNPANSGLCVWCDYDTANPDAAPLPGRKVGEYDVHSYPLAHEAADLYDGHDLIGLAEMAMLISTHEMWLLSNSGRHDVVAFLQDVHIEELAAKQDPEAVALSELGNLALTEGELEMIYLQSKDVAFYGGGNEEGGNDDGPI